MSNRDWSSDVVSSDLDRSAVLALEPRRNDRPGPVPRSVQTMNTAGGPVSEETTGVSHEFSGLGDVVSLTSAPQQIADHILSGIEIGRASCRESMCNAS